MQTVLATHAKWRLTERHIEQHVAAEGVEHDGPRIREAGR